MSGLCLAYLLSFFQTSLQQVLCTVEIHNDHSQINKLQPIKTNTECILTSEIISWQLWPKAFFQSSFHICGMISALYIMRQKEYVKRWSSFHIPQTPFENTPLNVFRFTRRREYFQKIVTKCTVCILSLFWPNVGGTEIKLDWIRA